MVADIQTIEVKSNRELRKFIKIPWAVYKDDQYWVPPIISEQKRYFNKKKNPFYEYADVKIFVAYKGSKPIGRICAAINHKYIDMYNDKKGFFGFFESVNDRDAAFSLFDVVSDWFKENKIESMRGPMNLSTHDPCGLLVDGFSSSPTIMMTYNPKYYVDLFDSYGFRKECDLFAYKIDHLSKHVVDKSNEVLKENPDIVIRKIDKSKISSETDIIQKMYNETMIDNWGYIPITDREIRCSVKRLKTIIDPDLVYFAEYKNETVAYSIIVPDYNIPIKEINGRMFPFGIVKIMKNKKNIKNVRAWALAVREDFREKKLGAVMYAKGMEEVLRKGYEMIEASWINENNISMNRALKWMGFEKCKTYRIYEYQIK